MQLNSDVTDSDNRQSSVDNVAETFYGITKNTSLFWLHWENMFRFKSIRYKTSKFIEASLRNFLFDISTV